MENRTQGIFIFYEWIEILEEMEPSDAMTVIRNVHRFAVDGTETEVENPTIRLVQDILCKQVKRQIALSARGRRAAQIRHSRNRAEASRSPVSQSDLYLSQGDLSRGDLSRSDLDLSRSDLYLSQGGLSQNDEPRDCSWIYKVLAEQGPAWDAMVERERAEQRALQQP